MSKANTADYNSNKNYHVQPALELSGGWGLNPQFMSTDAHFGVKIGFKFQSLGKISNISAADPPPSSFRSIPTLITAFTGNGIAQPVLTVINGDRQILTLY